MPENLEPSKIESLAQVQKTIESKEVSIEQQEVFENQELEKKAEEKKDNRIEQIKASISKKSVVAISEAEQLRMKQIDKILSAGLEDAYLSLSPQVQKEFKKKGEEATIEINKLLNKVKVNLGKIIKLIKKWLLIIPKINPFFLEQEAKIKADRILDLKNKEE